MVDTDDEHLWAPFLASRTPDRQAARLRTHARADQRRGQRHVPRRADALSRDEIVRVAIQVADAEGADAVTMRRIARELNAGTMSLYWHIASKEELLDLMIDEIQGGQPMPEPSGDWRQDMYVLARSTRQRLHQHQWMMDFLGGRPPTGPKSLLNLERVLASFDGLGLDSAGAIDIVSTVGTYVLGAVLREVQEHNNESFRDQQFAGLTEEEIQQVLAEFTERVRATGRYPRLLAMLDDRHDPDAAETRDARFEFGLECLIDGIAAHLPAQPATRPRPAGSRAARQPAPPPALSPAAQTPVPPPAAPSPSPHTPWPAS
jgi:AcrR family transcriptional regulator